MVDLEVSRMENDADRRVYRKSERARYAVSDLYEFDVETADILRIAALNRDKFGRSYIVFLELVLKQRESKIAAVYLHVFKPVFDKIRHAADMVFVSVSEDDTFYFVYILVDIRKIGNYQIDARRIVSAEHTSAVHDEYVVAVLDRGHVFSYFSDAA